MKYIKRKSIASIPLEGKISDTLNVEDKLKNAPSINLVEQMTGIPTEGIIQFDGTEDEIPEGYEKVNVGYSLEEQVVGTWIDGKPIYRKVVDFGNLPNATSKTVNHNISNLDILINSYGFGKRSDGYYFSVFYPNSNIEQSIRMLINSTAIEINTASIDRSNVYVYVILEYTKTTD